MKKIIFNILIIFTIGLFGCSKQSKFYLDEIYYNQGNKGLLEINNQELQELIDGKGSFAIYVYLNGCSSCAAFKPYLDDYLNQNNLQILTISILEVQKSNNVINSKIKYVPTIILFNQGELVTYLDPNKNSHTEYFKSAQGISEWINKYVMF